MWVFREWVEKKSSWANHDLQFKKCYLTIVFHHISTNHVLFKYVPTSQRQHMESLLDLKNCSVYIATINCKWGFKWLCILFFKNGIKGQMQVTVAHFCGFRLFFPWAPFILMYMVICIFSKSTIWDSNLI